jgi:hypothetical protein
MAMDIMAILITTDIIATAITVTSMDILMDITTLAATGMAVIMDQGMDPVIGDKKG